MNLDIIFILFIGVYSLIFELFDYVSPLFLTICNFFHLRKELEPRILHYLLLITRSMPTFSIFFL